MVTSQKNQQKQQKIIQSEPNSTENDKIYPKAVRYVDKLLKQGHKISIRQDGMITTALNGTEQIHNNKNSDADTNPHQEQTDRQSNGHQKNKPRRSKNILKHGKRNPDLSTPEVRSRFPVLGPTRHEAEVYLRSKQRVG